MIFGAIGAGVILFFVGIFVTLPWAPPTLPPYAEPADPLLARHEYLLRFAPEYSERLATMEQLEQLTSGTAKKLVLEEAQQILLDTPTTATAAAKAANNLSELARALSSDAGHYGLQVGPRMPPQVIDARIRDPQRRQKIAKRVFEFQKAACVHELLR